MKQDVCLKLKLFLIAIVGMVSTADANIALLQPVSGLSAAAVGIVFEGKSDNTYANTQGCQDGYSISFFDHGGGSLGSEFNFSGSGTALAFIGSPGTTRTWQLNSRSIGQIAWNAAQANAFLLSDIGSISVQFSFDPTSTSAGAACTGGGVDVADFSNYSVSCTGTDGTNATCTATGGAVGTIQLQ